MELIEVCSGLKMTVEQGNLAKALSAFQAEVQSPKKTGEAKAQKFSYKYVELPELLERIKPLLGKYGLSISQTPVSIGDACGVTTVLRHVSGEMQISGPFLLKNEKGGAQGAGSCVTYSRRYCISAILGVAWDDDDDAAAAMPKKEESAPWQVTDAMEKELLGMYELAGGTDLNKLLDKYKVNTLKDLGQRNFQRIYNGLVRVLLENRYTEVNGEWVKESPFSPEEMANMSSSVA